MSTGPQCAVIDTGNANTASIIISLRAHGISSARVTTSVEDVVNSPLVVLPGVGTFGQTMDTLRKEKSVVSSYPRENMCVYCVKPAIRFPPPRQTQKQKMHTEQHCISLQLGWTHQSTHPSAQTYTLRLCWPTSPWCVFLARGNIHAQPHS